VLDFSRATAAKVYLTEIELLRAWLLRGYARRDWPRWMQWIQSARLHHNHLWRSWAILWSAFSGTKLLTGSYGILTAYGTMMRIRSLDKSEPD